ncbi:MAG: DinB family protein [Chloroflexi bacterium]|nr:DinB family protein [Chloroflexota bacterium]
MYETAREAIETLRLTPQVLTTLLRDVSPARAQAARGGDEGWSVVEVVCHLRDTEEIALQRFRTLRDAMEGLIGGFDQEALARERNYAADDLAGALEAFVNLRMSHLAELIALTSGQWEKLGRHRTNGPVTILNHTLHAVWHDSVHIAQITQQLA